MNVINEAADIVSGTYGKLTITYRRLMYTWTVTVYNVTLRIEELCGTYDNSHAAWTECRRIASAAFAYVPIGDIIAAKPAELALAAVKEILDTVPSGEEPQVRPTLAGAHLAPLEEAQRRAIRVAGQATNRTVYVGQATRPTLKALARKGYGTLAYEAGLGRRKVIESL